MKAQKANFDEIEREIDTEFHKLDKTPKGMGYPWWTKEVKKAVGRIAKQRGYSVYASGMGGEWLYDLICLEYEEKYLKGIPIVLESEWKTGGVDNDFQKLVVARADHRVMVLQASDKKKKEVIEQLLKHVQKCRHSTIRDRYLFVCWNERERVFNCSVYVVER